MVEKIITTLEAWDDFEARVLPGLNLNWRVMNTLNQARRDRGKGLLGERRVKKILKEYAPGRYRFEERVILLDP